MKTQVTEFGFEVLVTYLLPGILVTLAVFIAHGIGEEEIKIILDWAKETQFLVSVILLALFALFGALVTSLQAVLESSFLDWLAPKLLKKEQEQLDKEWDFYVNNLPKNPYISRVVLFFQFETRLGLSALILGVALFFLSYLHAVIFLALGIFFYLIGISHHKELSKMREKYFNENH